MWRFVVQQHFRDAEDWHFDLMLECGDGLLTFSCPAAPDDPARLPALVRQLLPHRLAYLEYEGDISGDRGWCRIHDRGTFTWIDPGAPPLLDGRGEGRPVEVFDALTVRLEGGKVRGLFRLTREARSGADYWRLRLVE